MADLDLNAPEIQAAIKAAVEKAGTETAAQLAAFKDSVTKLEGNNKNLVEEKRAAIESGKKFKEMLDGLGGEEQLEGLKRIRDESEKNATLKLLSEGKLDEFYSAVTQKATAGLQKQLEAAQGQIKAVSGERDGFAQKYNGKLVDIAVREAAAKAGVHATAVEDIVLRAGRNFTVNEDQVVSMDANGVVKFGATGKSPYSVAEWLEEQREVAPHWWPASQGGGAGGSQGGSGGGASNPWSAAGWNLTAQGRVISEQGRDKAEQMAAAAGSKVGATRPTR